VDDDSIDIVKTWRTVHGDLTDEEWEIIGDFFPTYSQPGTLGRPAKWDKREVVNGILYVLATGCQWRALPKNYPHWNTVHRYHRTWSEAGVWEAVAAHVVDLVRQAEGRDAEPSAGIVDARSVRGAATVTGSTRGYDAGKKISGRKTFGIVDSLGLLIAITVVAANTSDNTGGIAVTDKARKRSSRFNKLWCDSGFKKTFIKHCRNHHVGVEVVKRIHAHEFVILPKRWIVERTWSWIMNYRRLQVDYERNTNTTEGFIWAAQTRIALRKLTETAARD
jgi:transposase